MLLGRSLHQAIPILIFCGFFNDCENYLYNNGNIILKVYLREQSVICH